MLYLGRTEDGEEAGVDVRAGHVLLTGVTRSGKSVTAYRLLAGMARDSTIKVSGVDPSGILLRPWAERGATVVLGGDDAAVVDFMRRVERTMMSRLDAFETVVTDKISNFTRQVPQIVVVLEEYPGLIAGADKKSAPEIQRVATRVAREGAKVGVMLLVIAQRPEKAVLGPLREQFLTVVCHRQDDGESVKMVGEPVAAEPGAADRVMSLPAGQCLIYEKARPLQWARVSGMGYAEYRDQVIGCMVDES